MNAGIVVVLGLFNPFSIKDVAMKNTKHTELSATQYLPEVLFERLCKRLGVRSYSALGRAIGLSPSVVSKVRNRRLAISSEILLKIHDATDIPVRELRRWMGDTRPFYSPLSPAIVRQSATIKSSRTYRMVSAPASAQPRQLDTADAHP